MIKHIVMWRLADEAEGKTYKENFEIIKSRLEALPKVIPQIKHIEVRENLLNGAKFNVILYSEFNSMADVEIYQNHPAHKDVAAYVALVRTDREAADYIV